jgi:hypothetical protein
MKKYLLKLIAVVLVVFVTIWNVKQRKNEYPLSDLALANIEALANANDSIDCSSKYRGPYCGIFIDVYGNGTKLYYP